MSPESRAIWLNAARTLAYLSPDAVVLGRTPFGSVVTLWRIRVPSQWGFRVDNAFQCRIACADGSLWSGRSTRGRNALTVYRMSEKGHTAASIRWAFDCEVPSDAP